MSKEKVLLKDQLFNKTTVTKLVTCINTVYRIDGKSFIEEAMQSFETLELKARMTKLRQMIERYIPENYEKTLEILKASLGDLKEGDESFVFGAYQDYIMINGCTDQHVETSLYYLGEFTNYFSAEFAIRAFINKYPDKTFASLMKWSTSEKTQQRRLASEGIRPRLPWAIAIDFDYKKAATLLDNLYYDSERYVTRSVANHLNDIAKQDPDFVVERLKKWQASNKQGEKEMNYLLNHALRTSIKRSHLKSLDLLGFKSDFDIDLSQLQVSNENLKIGEHLDFTFDIKANEDISLMIDYKINYPMANDKRSEKVFKLKKVNLGINESMTINKKHLFRTMTTKKLYSGMYTINLQINGYSYEKKRFYLEV